MRDTNRLLCNALIGSLFLLLIVVPSTVRAQGRMTIEASGGITHASAAAIAESGVDYLSSGAITHSSPSLDVGLDIEI